MLSKEAKELLSKNAELCKEISESYELHKANEFIKYESGKIYWVDVDKYWTDFVQNNQPNNCPHCGIPTDGSSNEQCYKAPKSEAHDFKKRWVMWRHKDNKTLVKSFVQGVVSTDKGDVYEFSDGANWTNYPNRVLKNEITIVEIFN
jgi:hypothetical protein